MLFIVFTFVGKNINNMEDLAVGLFLMVCFVPYLLIGAFVSFLYEQEADDDLLLGEIIWPILLIILIIKWMKWCFETDDTPNSYYW